MIYVLPGMGADSSMYRGEWRTLEQCVFLEWPQYRGEQTLGAIAKRVVTEAGMVDGDVVVGHSLGGMVACEISALRELQQLILVSSARNPEEISALLAALHPLASVTPFRFAQLVAARLPGDLYKMFARSDPAFMRATCRAVFEWPGLRPPYPRIHRIHGRHDRVIPLPREVDRIVEGGHVIPITHPQECVDFLRSVL